MLPPAPPVDPISPVDLVTVFTGDGYPAAQFTMLRTAAVYGTVYEEDYPIQEMGNQQFEPGRCQFDSSFSAVPGYHYFCDIWVEGFPHHQTPVEIFPE